MRDVSQPSSSRAPMTVGSLFSGIGGFDLGFTRAGYDIKWQIEIDPWARSVLARHWPRARRFVDVRRASLYNLESVDVICGGFPCTDISTAGKGLGIDGPESGLWTYFARIVRDLRPRYVVVENPSAILSRGLGRILGDLAEGWAHIEWDCIPAAAAGAPHLRDRLWLVAARDGLSGGRLLRLPQSAVSHSNGRRCSFVGEPEPGGLEGSCRGELVGLREGGSLDPLTFGASHLHSQSILGERTDGLPARLDGINGTTCKARPSPDVRGMWDAAIPQTVWSETGRPERLPSSPALRPLLHGDSVCQGHAIRLGLAKTGHTIPWGDLRVVWGYDESVRSSHRRESLERLTREHPDLMRELSFFSPPPCSTCWVDGGWEDGLSRVASGLSNHTQRLRGLGNAVVPQIAEWIARRIREEEEREPR